jgi:hypothetical protein
MNAQPISGSSAVADETPGCCFGSGAGWPSDVRRSAAPLTLSRVVTDGRLEADNDIAENALRPHDRADRKLNGLNPGAYLKDILTNIVDGHTINRIAELMPWRTTFPTPPQSP